MRLVSPRAFIAGCEGPQLTGEERRFFAAAQPWGLILFARNLSASDQIRRLVDEFREAVGRPDAPVLIDQEGGRVQRLQAPLAPDYPPAGKIGIIYQHDAQKGERAAWLAMRLIAEDLRWLGITVDCVPVLDLRHPGAHDIVGDRAYGGDIESVVALGTAAAAGLAAGGVAPVAKHVPGHGRALADSHDKLPEVRAPHEALAHSDFLPFRRLAHLPMAMTAHVLYSALDATRPATLSPAVVGDIIRGEIGFDGLLMSDDLSMGALSGRMTERAAGAIAAGCDIALHCNGAMGEMMEVAEAVPELAGRSAERAAAALSWANYRPAYVERLRVEFAELLAIAESAGSGT